MERILRLLGPLLDEKYAEFERKLIPNIDPEKILGIRTPDLKKTAKIIEKDPELRDYFISELPHDYFEENQIHAFILSDEKNYDRCIELLEQFLPHVDNWATCDQMSPKIFNKKHSELVNHAIRWTFDDKVYTRRFSIGMLMRHFLDEDFRTEYPETVADAYMDEYHVNMMRAWYFATALAKQYETTVKFIESERLDTWTHNKAIQKACESFRVSDDHKTYLRSLKKKLR